MTSLRRLKYISKKDVFQVTCSLIWFKIICWKYLWLFKNITQKWFLVWTYLKRHVKHDLKLYFVQKQFWSWHANSEKPVLFHGNANHWMLHTLRYKHSILFYAKIYGSVRWKNILGAVLVKKLNSKCYASYGRHFCTKRNSLD